MRVYVRETVGDVALTWQGRAIWKEILVKCDRAGLIALDGHGVRGLAGLIRMPPEMVEEHFQQILDDGRVQIHGDYLVVPNYIEAQEATQSDAQRQRECRARRRDKAMLGEIEKKSQNVNAQCDNGSQNVTNCRSGVTDGHSVPSRTVPNRTENKSTARTRVDTNKDFEKFWKTYPKKVGRKAALKAWKRAKKDGLPDIVRLVMVVEKQKRSAQWRQNNGQYIPNPETWLNQGRWDDEVNTQMGAKKTQHERNLEILGLREEDDGERGDSKPVPGDDIRVVPR